VLGEHPLEADFGIAARDLAQSGIKPLAVRRGDDHTHVPHAEGFGKSINDQSLAQVHGVHHRTF
jgi:hypothetical protein